MVIFSYRHTYDFQEHVHLLQFVIISKYNNKKDSQHVQALGIDMFHG